MQGQASLITEAADSTSFGEGEEGGKGKPRLQPLNPEEAQRLAPGSRAWSLAGWAEPGLDVDSPAPTPSTLSASSQMTDFKLILTDKPNPTLLPIPSRPNSFLSQNQNHTFQLMGTGKCQMPKRGSETPHLLTFII